MAEEGAPNESVRRDVEVGLDPDEVWELLVDDEERAGWFGGPTRLEPVPGGAADFTDPDGTRRAARVEEADPGRHLRWTWWPAGDGPESDGASRVDVDLEPVPGGTRISVTETPLAPTARAHAVAALLFDLELLALLRSATIRA